ncbi:putative metallopeptidase [Sporomusa aerivorans]|uniref:putative metallopeptidase n=1 Tax=Sporomusa aerivorans TaxID=204936 RepID=UPI00352A2D62
MAAEFYDASEDLEALARDIIEEYHGHLVEANIKYLFRTGNWEVKKRDTWGQAKKVGKEVNFLTGHDFIVTIHRDVWEQLKAEDKRALLDHELQHCSAGTDDAGNKVWYIQGHDVEDFHAIIRRHGLWSPALRKMEGLLNQTELELEPEDADPEEHLAALPGGETLAIGGRPELRVISSKPVQELPPPETDADVEREPNIVDADIIDIEVIHDTGTEA